MKALAAAASLLLLSGCGLATQQAQGAGEPDTQGPAACIAALHDTEHRASVAGDFAHTVQVLPPLISKALTAGSNADYVAMLEISATLKSATGELRTENSQLGRISASFKKHRAACLAAAH